MVAKLILTLEQGMQKALLHNQSSGLAACAKQIINLALLIHRITTSEENLVTIDKKYWLN